MSIDPEDIRHPNNTPPEWVPFETILCDCPKAGPTAGSRWTARWMFIGFGPFNPGQDDVQLVSRIDGISHQVSWSSGDYLKRKFHIYDPKTCDPEPR